MDVVRLATERFSVSVVLSVHIFMSTIRNHFWLEGCGVGPVPGTVTHAVLARGVGIGACHVGHATRGTQFWLVAKALVPAT